MKKLVLLCASLLSLSSCGLTGDQRPAPATHYGTNEGAGTTGIHAVMAGDTLWSISQRYNIALQDIAVTNNLQAPFALEQGQRLRLPPPQEYRVRVHDSLYTISRMFGVSTSKIAQQNNLAPPYMLQVGQVLKMPSVTRKTSAAIGGTISQETHSTPVKIAAQPTAGAQQANKDKDDEGGMITPGQKPHRAAQSQVSAKRSAPTKRVKKTKITAKTPKRSSSKFRKPVSGKIISSYGPKKNGLHNDGINIKAPKGAPIRAAENGVVVYAGDELKGSGNLVLLRHDNRWMTAYAHMDKIMINRGQTVKAGQTIGTVGSTGSVDSPQLHFEVRRGTEALNPTRYMGN